jgi:hypothetical protein
MGKGPVLVDGHVTGGGDGFRPVRRSLQSHPKATKPAKSVQIAPCARAQGHFAADQITGPVAVLGAVTIDERFDHPGVQVNEHSGGPVNQRKEDYADASPSFGWSASVGTRGHISSPFIFLVECGTLLVEGGRQPGDSFCSQSGRNIGQLAYFGRDA